MPKVAGFPVGIKLIDLSKGGYIGDTRECYLDPISIDQTINGVLIFSLLNKPANDQNHAYPTERNLHRAITKAIAELRKAGAPVPRYVLFIEADEEVGGEFLTFGKGWAETPDGQMEEIWVDHRNAYQYKSSAHPAILLSHEVHILIFSLLHDLLPGKIDLVISGSASQKIMKWFFAAFEEKMDFAIEGDGGRFPTCRTGGFRSWSWGGR